MRSNVETETTNVMQLTRHIDIVTCQYRAVHLTALMERTRSQCYSYCRAVLNTFIYRPNCERVKL